MYFIYRYQIAKIKRNKQQEISTNNKVAELRQSALSAMMNPHFVFNSLMQSNIL
jgi:LytS/YehU family sensor histidine kinase